jgi:hypothetical protein
MFISWHRTCGSNTLEGIKECMAQRCLIDKCNSNRYIRVIGEVEDYYGVHEIIAFNV